MSYYNRPDLASVADKVSNFYKNKEILDYKHNGKAIPKRYADMIERNLAWTSIEGKKSLHAVLSNAIYFSFNQTTRLNNAAELRIYRETSERLKLNLLSLNRKKTNGDTSVQAQIDSLEKDLKLVEVKINEIATLTQNKPEINRTILNGAEEAFNLLLRSDKTPYYFYAEVCKRLGIRINLDQKFPGFRDDDRKKVQIGQDDEDYKNYLDMNVKKSMYVPPALRKEETSEKEKRVEKLVKANDTSSTQPKEFKNDIVIQVSPVRAIGAWTKKIEIKEELLDKPIELEQQFTYSNSPKEETKEYELDKGWENMDSF